MAPVNFDRGTAGSIVVTDSKVDIIGMDVNKSDECKLTGSIKESRGNDVSCILAFDGTSFTLEKVDKTFVQIKQIRADTKVGAFSGRVPGMADTSTSGGSSQKNKRKAASDLVKGSSAKLAKGSTPTTTRSLTPTPQPTMVTNSLASTPLGKSITPTIKSLPSPATGNHVGGRSSQDVNTPGGDSISVSSPPLISNSVVTCPTAIVTRPVVLGLDGRPIEVAAFIGDDESDSDDDSDDSD
jgi:hypothetical protein